MTTSHEIRARLEEAAAFAREGNFMGAVARAREALRAAHDEASRDEAAIALAGFEAAERGSREAAAGRETALVARELADSENGGDALKNQRSAPARGVR